MCGWYSELQQGSARNVFVTWRSKNMAEVAPMTFEDLKKSLAPAVGNEDDFMSLVYPYAQLWLRRKMEPAELVVRHVTSSKGDTVYAVKVKGIAAKCTCLGWKHRQKCRHVTELRQELGIEGLMLEAEL
jgi:hypothetical protein